MTHERPARGRSESAARRSSEGSPVVGGSPTWPQVDAELEIRERLVAIADALDESNAPTALVNVRWLLEDLDALS